MKEMRWFWNLQEHLRLMWGTILQKCTSRLRCLLKYQVLSRFTLGIWFVKSLHFRLDCLKGWFFSEANFFAVEKKLNNTGICYCSFWASELIFAKLWLVMAQTNWVNARGGGIQEFKRQGWSNGGKNQNPQKSPGFPTKPQEIPRQTFTPPPQPAQKNSHAKFPSLLDSNSTRGTQELLLFINNIMENAIFFLKTQKNPA